jgi:hypothetical protein
MSNEECAKLLIQLHSDYFELAGKYGNPAEEKYAEAVAMAIMAIAERKNDEK